MLHDSAQMRGDLMPLTVNMYGPDGTRRMFYVHLPMRENGRWKGESLKGRSRDGIRLLTIKAREFFSFNRSGSYRLEVAQATSQYDLTGVQKLRVVVEETDIDYEKLNL